MFDYKAKNECFFHSYLINKGFLKTGSVKANKDLRKLLNEHKTFENIYFNNKKLFDSDLENSPLAKKICKDISKENDFEILTINDKLFPQDLKNVEYGTGVLYLRGNLDYLANDKRIAVVGTRELHEDSHKKEADGLLERLLNQDYTIVSGLAIGCDVYAHNFAISHNQPTIAVLGTPLNKLSPNKDVRLYMDENDLVVTEYPIGIRTFGGHFAHRNITTVGLTNEGIAVIRSPNKSGTQHAIREAQKQNKRLYALDNNKEFEWVDEVKSNYSNFRLVKNE